ncbi:VanZ family protein [Paenibacillus sp. TAB 01]|uniref:VanZ family protein n=1 Tax=Paenibacillus sp. TAB 01 TaxID=3368988 RepID=UPI003752BA2F
MRFLYHWLPVAIWMGVIYKLSSRTGEDMDGWLAIIHRWIPSMQGFDWGHFVAYYILGLAFAWAIAESRLTWSRMLIVVLLCILYGVTDEYHQSFVPGRTPDLADIRNDGIGAALAMLTLRVPVVRRTIERLHGVKYY